MSFVEYNIPSREKIDEYIIEAKQNNKGPWDMHSFYVGEAARIIADKCSDIDSEVAYAMGALHDIGRREGLSHMHHILSGYRFMIEEGYDDISRICLTHSFPYQDIREYFGEFDCTREEIEFIKSYLKTVKYNDYDRLIQLCDVLASADGYCLMEKRMVNVALRYGTNDFTRHKWKATFKIKDYFERKIGTSIYSILPNVVETTFGY